MKTQISRLTLILSMSILAMVLSYCAKEEIHPPTDLSQSKNLPVYEGAFNSDATVTAPENGLKDNPGPNLSSILASTNFKAHPDWGVDIQTYNCPSKAKTLLVYNPNDSNLDFYASDRFVVLWFKNGQPIRTRKNQLKCVCKGRYAVVILNKITNQAIGIAFSSGGICYDQEEALKPEITADDTF